MLSTPDGSPMELKSLLAPSHDWYIGEESSVHLTLQGGAKIALLPICSHVAKHSKVGQSFLEGTSADSNSIRVSDCVDFFCGLC